MNDLLCCSLSPQYRVAHVTGAMQGKKKKMRQKHLPFLTGEALHSPALTSYPHIMNCLLFAFLSFPPVDHELLTPQHCWLCSPISKALLPCWQGHSRSRWEYGTTAWRKTPRSQTLELAMPASRKGQRTLRGSSHSHCSAEPPLQPVLLSRGLYQCSQKLAAPSC